jgi:hypothetical protein
MPRQVHPGGSDDTLYGKRYLFHDPRPTAHGPRPTTQDHREQQSSRECSMMVAHTRPVILLRRPRSRTSRVRDSGGCMVCILSIPFRALNPCVRTTEIFANPLPCTVP